VLKSDEFSELGAGVNGSDRAATPTIIDQTEQKPNLYILLYLIGYHF